MERRNRYRNPVRVAGVVRLLFFCLLLGLVSGTFVFLRNLHVQSGDEIRRMEMAIAELDHELQLWEIRIAGAKDRIELNRRLKWQGSDLRPIDPSRILKIQAPAGPR